jgi:hypothetical protein
MARSRHVPIPCAAGRNTLAQSRLHVDERPLALESDLSTDMEITAEELDAIARLLGDELNTFLSKT